MSSTRRLSAAVVASALAVAACGSGDEEAVGSINLAEGTGDGSGATVAPDDLVAPTGEDDVLDADFRNFNGGVHSLAELAAGRPLVVNFFASWCAPCVAEMPEFERVHQAVGDEVQFVGLAVRDAPSDAGALAQTTGVTYPLGLDPAGDFVNVFGGLGMPTTAFVTADGTIARVHTGQLDGDGLARQIDEHLR